jgi:hypothetical protein
MVGFFRLDCKGVRSMEIESDFYFGTTFVKHVPTPDELRQWTTAPPQSINETLIIRGCAVARGRSTQRVH